MHTCTSERDIRLPAEWEPNQRSIVAWPGRDKVWAEHLEAGRSETAKLVEVLSMEEPVTVAVAPRHASSADAALSGLSVSIVHTPLDDCWARDISPLFCVKPDGEVVAVDFQFNAWGGKFVPHARDAAFGAAISTLLGRRRNESELVLEGGSISTDGAGAALIVEPTVVNSNRNPGLTRRDVERVLESSLGINRVVWLPFGLLGDSDTDGHVDNVAVFVAPGTVLCQTAPNPSHPDHERLAKNREALRRTRLVDGSKLDVVDVPWLPRTPLDASRPCSYLNIYIANRQVLTPVVGAATDDLACDLIAQLIPDRRVVPLQARALAYGGGGPHCMTMQVPSTSTTVDQGEDQ